MKKKRNKTYIEGYEFAIRYGEDNLTSEEEKEFGIFELFLENYNPMKTAKQVKDFDLGKIDAVEYMNEFNKELRLSQEDLSMVCFDGFCDESYRVNKLLESAENREEMEKLADKYSEGVSALIDFYRKIQIKEEYEI